MIRARPSRPALRPELEMIAIEKLFVLVLVAIFATIAACLLTKDRTVGFRPAATAWGVAVGLWLIVI